jgi:hypothetical protein
LTQRQSRRAPYLNFCIRRRDCAGDDQHGHRCIDVVNALVHLVPSGHARLFDDLLIWLRAAHNKLSSRADLAKAIGYI